MQRTSKLALELMNEPQYGWDAPTTERWQRMLELLHQGARAQAPDLLLVVTGARGGDATGLKALDPAPFAASNVLFSFHYYEPHDFTHQGVVSPNPSASHWRFISGLPYPAKSGDVDRVWARSQGQHSRRCKPQCRGQDACVAASSRTDIELRRHGLWPEGHIRRIRLRPDLGATSWYRAKLNSAWRVRRYAHLWHLSRLGSHVPGSMDAGCPR